MSHTLYEEYQKRLRDKLPQNFQELVAVVDMPRHGLSAFFAELVWDYVMWRRDRNTSKELPDE